MNFIAATPTNTPPGTEECGRSLPSLVHAYLASGTLCGMSVQVLHKAAQLFMARTAGILNRVQIG